MLTEERTTTADTAMQCERPRGCWHCGSAVPASLLDDKAERQFCCNGCKTAYEIIHECGLDEYYVLRREWDATEQPASAAGAHYQEMDDPVFHAMHVTPLPGGQWSVRLFLQGVHCAACVWLIERLPTILYEVEWVRVDLPRSTVEIRWSGSLQLSTIAQTIDRLGYPCHPLTDQSKVEAARREDRRQLARLGIAGACAGNNMLIAIALYAGAFSGMAADHLELFRWASAAVGLVSLLGPGQVFFRGAWAALRTRTTHLDVPLALGLGAGGIAGLVNVVRGVGDIYFDSLSVLVFFLLVGRWIQFHQQRKAADRVAMLRSLTPRSAKRITASGTETIPIEAIQNGDLLAVEVGAILPADGIVESGNSSVDEAILTGESRGRTVGTGDEVLAGSTNLSSPIRIRTHACGRDTRIAKLMDLVEDASLTRAPIVALAHRISGTFVIAVTALAALTAVYWYYAGSSAWLDHAIALLVVSCPCSLGLATPLAIAVAQGQAARQRILIKGGEVLERLAGKGTIWLDKTGTLSEGRMRLGRWHGPEHLLPMLAAVEQQAVHPIAQAITHSVDPADFETLSVSDFRQWHGAGVEAWCDGRHVLAGSPRLMSQSNIAVSRAFEDQIDALLHEGLTPVLMAVDGQLLAIAGVGDQLRSDAVETIRQLDQRGWAVGILSGDHPDIVAQVGRRLGLPPSMTKGGLLPEEKLAWIQKSADRETTVMVGDGVNDSAALAAATVGIAVKGGTEASMHAAQVYLAGDTLSALVDLLDGSRRTLRVIHRNFAISLGYNALSIALAMAGMINPLLAAVLMPISSLSVVAASVMSTTFGRRS